MDSQKFFTFYWILLVVSGVALLAMGGTTGRRVQTSSRVVNILFGVGFLVYGIYLGFIFKGGSYPVFFYAFVVPIALIVNTVRSINANKEYAKRLAAQHAAAQQHAGTWPQQGAPGAWPQPAPGTIPQQGIPTQAPTTPSASGAEPVDGAASDRSSSEPSSF